MYDSTKPSKEQRLDIRFLAPLADESSVFKSLVFLTYWKYRIEGRVGRTSAQALVDEIRESACRQVLFQDEKPRITMEVRSFCALFEGCALEQLSYKASRPIRLVLLSHNEHTRASIVPPGVTEPRFSVAARSLRPCQNS